MFVEILFDYTLVREHFQTRTFLLPGRSGLKSPPTTPPFLRHGAFRPVFSALRHDPFRGVPVILQAAGSVEPVAYAKRSDRTMNNDTDETVVNEKNPLVTNRFRFDCEHRVADDQVVRGRTRTVNRRLDVENRPAVYRDYGPVELSDDVRLAASGTGVTKFIGSDNIPLITERRLFFAKIANRTTD